jgi:hypothetical protein
VFAPRVAKDHGAQPSIADGERLALPVLGRLMVVKCKLLARHGRGQDEYVKKGASSNSHWIIHYAFYIVFMPDSGGTPSKQFPLSATARFSAHFGAVLGLINISSTVIVGRIYFTSPPCCCLSI